MPWPQAKTGLWQLHRSWPWLRKSCKFAGGERISSGLMGRTSDDAGTRTAHHPDCPVSAVPGEHLLTRAVEGQTGALDIICDIVDLSSD